MEDLFDNAFEEYAECFKTVEPVATLFENKTYVESDIDKVKEHLTRLLGSDEIPLVQMGVLCKTNLSTLTVDYVVSPKIDGERCLVYTIDGLMYFVYRDFCRVEYEVTTIEDGYVLDVERIHGNVCVLLDAIRIPKGIVRFFPLRSRLNFVRDIVFGSHWRVQEYRALEEIDKISLTAAAEGYVFQNGQIPYIYGYSAKVLKWKRDKDTFDLKSMSIVPVFKGLVVEFDDNVRIVQESYKDTRCRDIKLVKRSNWLCVLDNGKYVPMFEYKDGVDNTVYECRVEAGVCEILRTRKDKNVPNTRGVFAQIMHANKFYLSYEQLENYCKKVTGVSVSRPENDRMLREMLDFASHPAVEINDEKDDSERVSLDWQEDRGREIV